MINLLIQKCCMDTCTKFNTLDDCANPLKLFQKKDDTTEVEEESRFDNPIKKKTHKGNKSTKYEDLKWNSLPAKAKLAAQNLGFNKESWDEDGWPACEDKWWDDLTPAEKTAATNLGWDINSWDNKYEEVEWKNLPAEVKRAAQGLGFTKAMWEDDEWPEALDEWWDDLSDEKRRGLMVLGYTKWAWD